MQTFEQLCIITRFHTAAVAQVRAFAPRAGGLGFDNRPRHTKDVIKLLPYLFLLLITLHKRIDLTSLLSQTSGMSGRE